MISGNEAADTGASNAALILILCFLSAIFIPMCEMLLCPFGKLTGLLYREINFEQLGRVYALGLLQTCPLAGILGCWQDSEFVTAFSLLFF